ncbi:hypothetical protein Anapl_01349 [Anas platyrhynchos]|uniref:Uncharacterized protein n=1 Tax=Anas platyrhynchos TaxID=8839 RepID=R0LU71_ANAPL|nr:hypothetical protein Anapl_01349 [Anas platyrhynchos]
MPLDAGAQKPGFSAFIKTRHSEGFGDPHRRGEAKYPGTPRVKRHSVLQALLQELRDAPCAAGNCERQELIAANDGRWVRISLHASSCIPILAVAGCPYTQSPRSRAGWRFPTAQKDAEKPPKERKPESTMRPIAAVPLTA